MKDKRNCGVPYPMYPQYPQTMPIMGMANMPNPYMTGYTQGYNQNSISSNTIEQQLNNLEQQLNNLENRVTKLENMTNNNSQYNGSNYYMV